MVHIQAPSSFQTHSSPFTPSPYPLRYPIIFSSFLTWISQPFFLLPVDYVLLLGAGNPDHYRNCSLHLSVWQHWQHRLLMLHEERQQADHTSKDWKIKDTTNIVGTAGYFPISIFRACIGWGWRCWWKCIKPCVYSGLTPNHWTCEIFFILFHFMHVFA